MPDSLTPARPAWDDYYMTIAFAVRRRANCTGNRVGALLVRDNRIIATGYNGTPAGVTNCLDGGCDRCAHRDRYPSGQAYDLCTCIHAEQNAILMAARTGIAVAGATLYTTMRPCFGCAKEALQAGVVKVVYLHDWRHPDETIRAAYEKFLEHFPHGCHPLALPDPEEAWAVSTRRPKT